ncbi:MAG: putative zinc-binding metallopeptidase [Siphonobacter sp.]
MKTYSCQCENILHFENSSCVVCNREVGWCPVCKGIHSFDPMNEHTYSCNNCQSTITKCVNYRDYHVCNRMVQVKTSWEMADSLCDCCKYNRVVPDLNVPGNQEKWYKLETAKRRMFYNLNLVGFPAGTEKEGFELPLSFDFKGNVMQTSGPNQEAIVAEKVMTGHADGNITINIEEADPVHREQHRVEFSEAHRTLIGHFRHEIGHYYWQLLVQHKCEDEFIAVFGDHNNPSYSDAMNAYYQSGPKPEWQLNYISAYASMHPWEDFAETFRGYMEMISILDTAENVSLLIEEEDTADMKGAELNELLKRYEVLGIKLNELNRSMGLLDLVPEVYNTGVIKKIKFIHQIARKGRQLKKEWDRALQEA